MQPPTGRRRDAGLDEARRTDSKVRFRFFLFFFFFCVFWMSDIFNTRGPHRSTADRDADPCDGEIGASDDSDADGLGEFEHNAATPEISPRVDIDRSDNARTGLIARSGRAGICPNGRRITSDLEDHESVQNSKGSGAVSQAGRTHSGAELKNIRRST